jgi:small GTP-binding protein
LKAKLARLRNELFVEQSGGGGGGGEGFDVARNGDARIALIGFPSVGKSSLLNSLTTTESEAAGYEFTTLTCIPGVLRYKGSKMQVLDLPGIIEGAAHGAGRGREVIAVARSADAILIVLDAGKEGLQKHREILERELETVGIRLNQRAPDVTLTKRKAGGGVRFASTVPQPLLGVEPEKLVTQILREYRITSADILAREEITVDQLVDVIQGNREYKPCLYLYNKIDTVTVEEVDQLARMPNSIVGSVAQGFNISGPFEDDRLKQMMWDYLGLTRVYTKRKGKILIRYCRETGHGLFISLFRYFRIPSRCGRTSCFVRDSKGNNSEIALFQRLLRIAARLQLCPSVGYQRKTCSATMWTKSYFGR